MSASDTRPCGHRCGCGLLGRVPNERRPPERRASALPRLHWGGRPQVRCIARRRAVLVVGYRDDSTPLHGGAPGRRLGAPCLGAPSGGSRGRVAGPLPAGPGEGCDDTTWRRARCPLLTVQARCVPAEESATTEPPRAPLAAGALEAAFGSQVRALWSSFSEWTESVGGGDGSIRVRGPYGMSTAAAGSLPSLITGVSRSFRWMFSASTHPFAPDPTLRPRQLWHAFRRPAKPAV